MASVLAVMMFSADNVTIHRFWVTYSAEYIGGIRQWLCHTRVNTAEPPHWQSIAWLHKPIHHCSTIIPLCTHMYTKKERICYFNNDIGCMTCILKIDCYSLPILLCLLRTGFSFEVLYWQCRKTFSCSLLPGHFPSAKESNSQNL